MKNIAAAIEFGTSKIVCIIGREKSVGRFEVLGSGEAKYEGISKGSWLKPENIQDAIAKAMLLAEKIAKMRVREVYIGVPGAFCKVVCRDGFVEVKDGKVSKRDVDNLVEDAHRFSEETKYVVVTKTPVYFVLDDNNHYVDVIGNETKRMHGKVSFVLSRRHFVQNITKMLKKMSVEVKAFIPDVLAESLFLVPTAERDTSAVLLNVGYYDTNVTVVYGDAIVYNKTIFVAGMQTANDLALVMNIDVDTSEQIKRRYSFGISGSGEKLYDYAKNKDGKMEKYSHSLISEIIDARIEQLCILIIKALEQCPIAIGRRTRIFLSGGGLAMMRGAKDILQKYLNLQVRLTSIEAPQMSTPNYYTALALLDYVFEANRLS